EISFRQYHNSLNWVRTMAFMKYGSKLKEVEKFLNLEEEARQNLVLLEYAGLEKMSVSNNELASFISSIPMFKKNGEFDQETYRNVLRYGLGITPDYFENGIRNSLCISEIKQNISDTAKVTGQELKQYYGYINEKAKVKYTIFRFSDFEKDVNITEKQIKKYFEANRNEFKEPETVKFQYVFFDRNPDTIKADEEMETLITMLEQDEKDWDELEVKESEFMAKGNSTEDIPPECIEAAFSLETGEISDLIETEKGYFIIKPVNRKAEHIPGNYKFAADAVKEKIMRIEAVNLARSKAEKCLSKVKQSRDMASAAKEYSKKVTGTELFTRFEYVKELGIAPDFKRITFNLTKDSPFAIAPVNSGFCVLELVERKGADMEIFEKEKEKLMSFLLDEKKQRIFNDWYTILKEKAQVTFPVRNDTSRL
ncbi:peptidyl-prolyl cis-trans isomerase, partial [candidate division WOR-3 bacterium]|nr:peptidyl-prolyl cis-trans isomerase [candidate division WOR-3 bacterium]